LGQGVQRERYAEPPKPKRCETDIKPAVEAREEPLRQITLEWLSKVDEFKGQPLDWSLFASLMTFDMTGRIGFSHDFGGLRAGKRSPIQTHIQALFRNLSTTGQVPWLVSMLQRSNLPINEDITAFEKLAKTLVRERLAVRLSWSGE
jgi:cytochrome P450 family 628